MYQPLRFSDHSFCDDPEFIKELIAINSRPKVKAVFSTVVNPQTRSLFFPKTAPRRLYKVKRITPQNQRQILFTPSQQQATKFYAESLSLC